MIWTKGLYGGLSGFFVALGIVSYLQGAPQLISLVLGLAGFLPLFLLIMAYRTRYILTDDSLVCEWTFGKTTILYDEIDEVTSYSLPKLSIRRFGISRIGGRYSNRDVGKFYAMYGGKGDGLLVVADSEGLYGGKLYLTPKNEAKFVDELKKRANATISIE